MKTNMTELKEHYEALLKGGIYESLTVNITTNEKKVANKTASMTITISNSNEKTIPVSIYIVEKDKFDFILVVNDISHDPIFNSTGPNVIEKAEAYIMTYIERSTKKLLGMQVDSAKKTFAKKPNNKKINGKHR